MTKIFLIRHAEAEGNRYRIVQGHDNCSLTEEGRKQVRSLACRFETIHIDAVYSSNLCRACETASELCVQKNLPLFRDERLREIHLGPWERRSWDEIARDWPEQLFYFKTNVAQWYIEGAERPQDALERIEKVMYEIAADNEGKTVAIVSHGFVILLLLATLHGLTLEEVRKLPSIGNTAVSLIEFEENRTEVVFINDDSHLRECE